MTEHRVFRRLIIIMITIAAAMAICFAAAPSFAADSDITYHDSEKEAVKELREHMSDRESKVKIGLKTRTDEKGLKKLIGRLVRKATAHTGVPTEGDYIKFQYESYKGSAIAELSGVTPVVEVEYDLSYYDDTKQEEETDKKVKEIIESLDLDKKTNYEKISAIYEYICDNVEYEMAEDNSNIRRTAYGALVEGKAVCQGYSVSLYRLLLEAGIDNRIIFGEGVSPEGTTDAHTWNIVDLHGRYYYVDATWGDSAGRSEYLLRPAGSGFEDEHIPEEKYTKDSFTEKYPMAKAEYSAERDSLMIRAAGIVKWLADSIGDAFDARSEN